ncbi:MAG: Hsp70 family protein [Blastocatellia bacterium]
MIPLEHIMSPLTAMLDRMRTSTEPVLEKDSPIAGPDGRTNQALGISAGEDDFAQLIPAGQPLAECRVEETLTTDQDRQTSLRVQVYRGINRQARFNHLLGQYVILGIPPDRKGAQEILITLLISPAREIILSAQTRDTGKALRIRKI